MTGDAIRRDRNPPSWQDRKQEHGKGNELRLITFILVWLAGACVLWAPEAAACRYNIRDTAFVTFSHESYRLIIFTNSRTPAKTIEFFETAAHVLLPDSNVRFEIIDADRETDHPALRFRPPFREESGCSMILVPPFTDCCPRVFTLPEPASNGGDTVRTAMEGAILSPMRSEIAARIVESFGIVLLVEGEDAGLNSRARAVISESIESIREMLPRFPRPVHAPGPLEEPPHLLVVPREVQEAESVLLWSLGLGERDTSGPVVAVLHGRGRRIGPMLRGERISVQALAGILSVIGRDCDCALPGSWITGRTIPLRWDEASRTAAARVLGFDPESPMVRREVGLIVGNGPGKGNFDPAGSTDDPLFGYREIEITFDNIDPVGSDNVGPGVDGTSHEEDRASSNEESSGESYTMLGIVVCAIAVIVLIWGIVLLGRAPGRTT